MSSSADTGAHLDDLIVAELPPIEGEPEAVIPREEYEARQAQEAAELEAETAAELEAEAAAARLSIDDFWTVFRSAWSVPQGFDPAFAPLAVQPHEEEAARAASDAVYELIAIYYPSLLTPNTRTGALLLAMAPFMIAKVATVRAIMAEKRAKPVGPPPQFQRAQDTASAESPPPPSHHPDSSPAAGAPPDDKLAYLFDEKPPA